MFDNQELLALANHDLQRNELEGALAKVKQVLASENPSHDAYSFAARLYARLGMFERARGHFQEFLQYQPDAAHEIFEMGMTYAQQNMPAEALREWSRTLALVPSHPPALFFSADLLARTSRANEARRHLELLFQSAAPDNMYVERAKQLLQALEAGQSMSDAPFGGLGVIPSPYGGH